MNGARLAKPVPRPPPLPVEGFHIDVAWHGRRDDDPVVQHVARAMIMAFAPKRVPPPRRR